LCIKICLARFIYFIIPEINPLQTNSLEALNNCTLHFKDNPVTPGVILTEVMAQIGVVCLGIFLLKHEIQQLSIPKIALTSNQIDFFLPVFPGEKVTVISEKEFFRFNKLKCKVQLFNASKELVCRGFISGMIK